MASKSKSPDSLLRMIETGKKVCLVPLIAGGTLGIGHLGEGHFDLALKTVGTSAAMTLIYIATLAIGEYIVRWVIHKFPTNTTDAPREGRGDQQPLEPPASERPAEKSEAVHAN